MLGFLIGTVCLMGLFKVVRRGRYGYGGHGHFGGWHGMHYGHGRCGHFGGGPFRGGPFRGGPFRGDDGGGPYGYGGDGYGGDEGEDESFYASAPWQGGRGRGFFGMRMLFSHLETTPGQEKVIREAFEELRAKSRVVKDDARGMRGDLATAFRGESLDAETLGTVASRASSAVDGVRDAAIGAILKVHNALDERQRGIAADLMQSGPRFGRGWRGRGGPYRGAWERG